LVVDVRVEVQQEGDDLLVADLHGAVQGGVTPAVRNVQAGRVVRQQQLGGGRRGKARGGGEEERRVGGARRV
jgi:hypothetical protein